MFASAASQRPFRVFMMDLWCIVPYYTGYLCEHLQKQGVDVTLGSITYQYDPAHFSRHGIRNDPGALDLVARLQIRHAVVRRGMKFAEVCINLVWLPIRFLRNRPDILHVEYLQLIEQRIPFETWLIRFARRLGIKLVYTVHNELPPDTGDRHSGTLRRIYGLMDAIICHSEAARHKLISSYGVAAERIQVIPHGPLFAEAEALDTRAARSRLGLDTGDPVVLWQGWIKPYKGVPFLLDAWAKVQQQHPRAKLVIAGSGDETSLREIQQQVASLGIENSVRLELRFLDVAELPVYFSAADILVYPYRWITTSGALMTGLNYEKAIVATDLPAFQEILEHGRSALLAPYGDTEAFANALLTLMNDAGLRSRLAANAHQIAAQSPNSWQQIAVKTQACYESLLVPALRCEHVPLENH